MTKFMPGNITLTRNRFWLGDYIGKNVSTETGTVRDMSGLHKRTKFSVFPNISTFSHTRNPLTCLSCIRIVTLCRSSFFKPPEDMSNKLDNKILSILINNTPHHSPLHGLLRSQNLTPIPLHKYKNPLPLKEAA